MTALEYLSIEELVIVSEYALGGRPEVRDWGLLEVALGRPRATVFGQDAYGTLPEKSAVLLHSLVTNHALVDGDKRLGWVACRAFLGLNGFDVRASEDEKYDLVYSIADGSLTSVEEIAKTLRVWVVPIAR